MWWGEEQTPWRQTKKNDGDYIDKKEMKLGLPNKGFFN
jgi:hypothetical protein